jgi:biotin carboxyl carrier protein
MLNGTIQIQSPMVGSIQRVLTSDASMVKLDKFMMRIGVDPEAEVPDA